jgi:hypothetical protein
VGQPDAVASLDQQPLGLAQQHRVLRGQAENLPGSQQLAEREQLDGLALGRVEVDQSRGDELDQRGAGMRPAHQVPQALVVAQRSRLDGAPRELAEVQGVSPGGFDKPVRRRELDRVAEDRFDQRQGVVVAELGQLDARRRLVLPQRDDGVRTGLARAHGGQYERGADAGQV